MLIQDYYFEKLFIKGSACSELESHVLNQKMKSKIFMGLVGKQKL